MTVRHAQALMLLVIVAAAYAAIHWAPAVAP